MTIRIDVNSEGAIKKLIDTCGHIQPGFVLDLSDLLFADDTGVDVLRAISDQETKIRGASQFIQLLLNKTPGQWAESEDS
jgi:anti-anti-sigma regulatory factor